MTLKEEGRRHNSSYTQVGVQCFKESEVLNQSSVILMKFSAKSPHLRVAANRWQQLYPPLPPEMKFDEVNPSGGFYKAKEIVGIDQELR